MATPQYGTLIAALGSPNGPRKSIRVYASDAAGGLTYPSGSTTTVLSGDADVYLVDLFFAATLATTPTLTFFAGGLATGDVVNTAVNIGTTIGRQLQQAPIRIPKGREISIIQS